MDKLSIGQVVYIHPELGDEKQFPSNSGPSLNHMMRRRAGSQCIVSRVDCWYWLESPDGTATGWTWDRCWLLTEEEFESYYHWDATDEEITAIL